MISTNVNSATQIIKLVAGAKQTEKIVVKPGQAIQLMVDGQLYTGQKTINGRTLRLVRKNGILVLEADGQALAEVEGFFSDEDVAAQATSGEVDAAEDLLGALDAQTLFEAGSSVELAAADAGTLPAISTPSWGTLIAQAATGAVSTTAAATTTTTAAAGTAAAATTISTGALVAAAVVGVAIVANDNDGESTPPPSADTIIEGTVTAGPVVSGHNLSVTIYDLTGKALVSGVTVKPDGTFTANLGSYAGPIVAVLVDGGADADYMDETTLAAVDLSAVLMTATTVSAGATVKLNVNPVTTAAALKAGITTSEAGVPVIPEEITAENFETEAEAAATAVAKALGLADANDLLSGTVVTTVTTAGESNLAEANNYGKALAVISAMDTTQDGSGTAGVLNDLASGINDDGTTTAGLDAKLDTAKTLAKVLIVDIGDATDSGSVAENATSLVVYTPVADASVTEGTIYTYALSGTDADLFSVNPETGVVSFKEAPDHEAAADAGADNVYNVILTVTASNTDSVTDVTQTSTDSIALAITVTDVADVEPVFTSGATATVAENTATAVVYTAAVTPDVSGATVHYSLSGVDADLFDIDTNGVVTINASPDYEAPADDDGDNVYNINVNAMTDSVSSNQAVVITVTNVNEAPTKVGEISAQTAVLNQTYTLDAASYFADVDAGDAGTYTLTAGALPAGLSLNAETGAITGTATATAAVGSYTITRTDAGGLTATQTFDLSVVDKPSVLSFSVTDTDATSPNTATKGNSGETLQFVVTLSEAVTSEGSITAVFTVNGVDVTATSTAVAGSSTITFTGGTVPSTGNGSTITLKSLAGTITGDLSEQALLVPAAGAISHSGYTVDNTLPTITAAYNVAENTDTDTALKSVTLAANESVTWSGLTGDDASAFTLGTGADAGKLMFTGVTDKETKGSYTVTVTGTDDVGNATSQAVTVTVDNVNEAPTLSVPSTTTTAVVGQALALADFAVDDLDSATVTVTLTATNGTIGGVQDADANTAGIQVTGTVSAVNTALAATTFTATAEGAASVGIAVTDGSLNASGTYSLTAVTAPSLSTTLGGVSNLDARSNIVLTASENVTAVAGKYITLTNTGGTGFHGENVVNTFQFEATDPRVTINGNKITINPSVDLDLANNYTLSIEEGAFLGEASGEASVAFAPISFSTVAPMDAAGGTAGTLSQTMGTDGALAAGAYWLDLEDRSNPNSSAAQIDAANKDFVFVAADYSRATPPTSGPGDDGVATDDFFVRIYNFGLGDMLYIDTLGDNSDVSQVREELTTFSGAGTDTLSGAGTKWKGITFAGIVVGDGSQAGDTSGGGLGSTIRLSLEPSDDTPSDHTVAVNYANLPDLLGTDIGNIYAVL